MSLIQEALRRQQQEQEAAAKGNQSQTFSEPSSGAEISEGPPGDDAQPQAPASEAKSDNENFTEDALPRKPRTAPVLALLFILLVAAIVAAVFLFSTLKSMWLAPGTPPDASSALQQETLPTAPSVASVSATAPAPAAQVQPDPGTANVEPDATAALANNAVAGAAPASVPKIEKQPHKPPQRKPEPKASKMAEPVSQPEQVRWPALKLNAVVSNPRSGSSAAMLNSRLVDVGDEIENVILLEVLSDSVRLKCGNETRTLYVGQSL